MGSTPNSSRLVCRWSRLFLVLAVELRAEETGRSLQNLVRPFEFSHLLLKLFDPRRLRSGHSGGIPVVDIGLPHAQPHRLHPVAELTRHPVHRPVLGAQLRPQRAHHPHRSGLLLRAVSTRRGLPRRLFLWHDSILVSKVRSLRDFPGDSSIPVAMDSHDAAHYRTPVVPIGRTQESKPLFVLAIGEAQPHPDSSTCRHKPIGLSCSDAAAVAHCWGDGRERLCGSG